MRGVVWLGLVACGSAPAPVATPVAPAPSPAASVEAPNGYAARLREEEAAHTAAKDPPCFVELDDPAVARVRKVARRLLDERLPNAPSDIECCLLTAKDALCKSGFYAASANHTVGHAIGTRLVGVHAGSAKPWFDAPYEVAGYGSMAQRNPPWDVGLTLTVDGASFSLTQTQGKCPEACDPTDEDCEPWMATARKACQAAGTYRVANGALQR